MGGLAAATGAATGASTDSTGAATCAVAGAAADLSAAKFGRKSILIRLTEAAGPTAVGATSVVEASGGAAGSVVALKSAEGGDDSAVTAFSAERAVGWVATGGISLSPIISIMDVPPA